MQVKNEKEEIIAILWILHDLSKEFETEQQINEQISLLQSVFAVVPAGVAVMRSIRDEDGNITDFEFTLVNKQTEETTRRTDLVGKRLFETYPPAKEILFEGMVKTVETGEIFTVE